MLGAFKFSEHNRSPNFNTVNILNAQIKKTRALTQMETIEVESAVRGYHVYQSIWTPTIGETLVCKCEGGSRQIRCRSPRVTNFGVPKILIIRKIMCFKIWQFYRIPNLSAR